MINDKILKVKTISPNQIFFLSKVFNAHKNDVKCIVNTSAGSIMSCSRDGSVKLWIERAGSFYETFEIKQNKKFAINALAFYQSENDDWLVFAGIKDGTIEVYNSVCSKPYLILKNHTQNVCVLYVDTERKLLISGSWDARAVVWSIDKILKGSADNGRELIHHKYSVWAAITLPSEKLQYLTASADRTIQLMNEDFKKVRSYSGHNDVVRALCAISATQFISSANDGTICLWNVDSEKCVQQCETTAKEFVYTITKLVDKFNRQFVIAGMERGFVEIWSLVNNFLVSFQCLRIPVSSIWTLTATRNSDVILGTSSGSIYVYTIDETKRASESVMVAFDTQYSLLIESEIAAQQATENGIVTIKVALDDGEPSLELNYEKGNDPADTAKKFIKENNLPFSYLNEITEYIKANIPEAHLAEASKNKFQRTEIDGEKFDYAFEVKLSENGPPMHLGYNVGEDPKFASKRFVTRHQLTSKFIPQLSNYLCTQVPELLKSETDFVQIGKDNNKDVVNESSFLDPFTGASRYVPGKDPQSAFTSPEFSASYGRYVPGEADSEYYDRKRPHSQFVPIRFFFQFGIEGVSAKVIPKLREMNVVQINELILDENQIDAMNMIMSLMDVEVDDYLISAIDAFLGWSIETIVPALDVFRVALLNEKINTIFCSPFPPLIYGKIRGSETLERLLSLLISSESQEPVKVLVCRALTNAAVHEAGRNMLMTDISTVFKAVLNQLMFSKPSLQIAATSVIANCARLMLLETESGLVTELGPREDALRAIINVTEKIENFNVITPDALLRLLQSIATLMWGDTTVIELACSRNVKEIINRMKDSITDEMVKSVCTDIVEMIYAI